MPPRHSEKGEDFLTCQPDYFAETAVSPERKSKNRSQGRKLTVMPKAKNGSLTEIGVVFFLDFGPKKRVTLLYSTQVLAPELQPVCNAPNGHIA